MSVSQWVFLIWGCSSNSMRGACCLSWTAAKKGSVNGRRKVKYKAKGRLQSSIQVVESSNTWLEKGIPHICQHHAISTGRTISQPIPVKWESCWGWNSVSGGLFCWCKRKLTHILTPSDLVVRIFLRAIPFPWFLHVKNVSFVIFGPVVNEWWCKWDQ